MDVNLPDFFVALSLSEEAISSGNRMKEKDAVCCEETTRRFLTTRLQTKYPHLTELDLKTKKFKWQSKKAPDPRFQAYLQVQGIARFSEDPVPTGEETFDAAGELFNEEYLNLLNEENIEKSPMLASAIEVQIGLVNVNDDTSGAAVQSPNFYMGFVCDPSPEDHPTEEELLKLQSLSYPTMIQRIKKSYDGYQDIGMKIARTEIGEDARKPTEEYNLYIEFEANANFSKNAPSPMQFYTELSSFSIEDFLPKLKDLGGSFEGISEMVIHPCALIEDANDEDDGDKKVVTVFGAKIDAPKNPPIPKKHSSRRSNSPKKKSNSLPKKKSNSLPKKSSSLPKSSKKSSHPTTPVQSLSPSRDKEAVEGPSRPKPPGYTIVKAYIFTCLSIPGLEEEPSKRDYHKLTMITMDFYSDFMLEKYKDTLHKVEVLAIKTSLNAGIPEEKFNLYVEWDIAASFNDSSTAPDRVELCKMLLNDIDIYGFLKDEVRSLSGTPFENACAIYTEQVDSLVED